MLPNGDRKRPSDSYTINMPNTMTVSVENLDNLNLKLAMTRQHRLDHVQSMDTKDVSEWIGAASAAVRIHIYIMDERGLYAGRLIQREDELVAVGGHRDLRRVGLA